MQSVEEKPRKKADGSTYPCKACAGDMTFSPEHGMLYCQFCGSTSAIEDAGEIIERDLHEALKQIAQPRFAKGQQENQREEQELTCRACSATVVFEGTEIGKHCAFCGEPVVLSDLHAPSSQLPVDGVLPKAVSEKAAKEKVAAWVKGLWFAPGDFVKRGVNSKVDGVYLPYFTFDAQTESSYTGERGEDETRTVGSGDNERTETVTHWYSTYGHVSRFFDDVLVPALEKQPNKGAGTVSPWPLKDVKPPQKEYLAGFLTRTYDLALDEGFSRAKKQMERGIEQDVRRDIGGDRQRVHNIDSTFSDLTYKLILLPLWLMTYKYNDKSYSIAINGSTGRVSGDRPYSITKITFAVVTGLLALVALYFFIRK